MNLDDVTLLTSYLDGELGEPERLRVEAAVRANPHLADQLRELAQVRDLVSGMGRPATPCDLGLRVTAEIERRRHRLGPAVWWQFVRTAALVAAAILVSAALLHSQRLPLRGRPGGRPIAQRSARPVAPAHSVAATTAPSEAQAQSPAARALAKQELDGPDEAELQSERDRQRLLRLLDEPGVRRVFIEGDQIDVAADQVDDLLRNTARRSPRFGRISVNQGIEVDPRHPDEARVFIAVMDEKELNYFRGQVEKKTQLAVQADSPAPARIVTLLADFSQVSIVEGSPVASALKSPPPEFDRPLSTVRSPQSRSVTRETVLTAPDLLPPEDGTGPAAVPPGAAPAAPPERLGSLIATRPASSPVAAQIAGMPPGEAEAARGGRAPTPGPDAEPLLTVLVWVSPRAEKSAGLP